MRRVPFLLALVILSACLASVRAKTTLSPNCSDYAKGQTVRVCTELDEAALSGPGRSTTWRVWVEGDGNPIQVRLHNNSPRVVRLKGGDDQIVHMGCRWHREVRRKVTAIGPGKAKLAARPYSTSAKQEAATIAAAVAPQLAQIEAEFKDGRAKLPQTQGYPGGAVKELLDSTETELLEVLNYQELTAMRDYVKEVFREARNTLAEAQRETRAAKLYRHFAPQVALASFRSSPRSIPGVIPEEKTDQELDKIEGGIRNLVRVSERKDYTVKLCVISGPVVRADFFMHPKSYPQGTQHTVTNGEIQNVWRGIYAYEMRQRRYPKIRCKPKSGDDPFQCPLLDLMGDQLVFDCNLNDGLCKQRTRAAQDCQPLRPEIYISGEQ